MTREPPPTADPEDDRLSEAKTAVAIGRADRHARASSGSVLRFMAVPANDPEVAHPIFLRLCAALGQAVPAEVVGIACAHYDELLEVVALGRFDLVWLPPLLALRAVRGGAAEPLVLPMRNGAVSYSTALFVRPDSRIHGVDELAGTRVAWVDKLSVGGYLMARAMLRARGIEPGRTFAEEQFLGSHAAVARAVERGRADVGATFAYFAEAEGGVRWVRHAGWGEAPARVLCDLGGIPMDLLAVHPRVPAELREAIVRVFVGDTRADAGRVDAAALARSLLAAESFERASAAPFAELSAVLRHVEFDPAG